MKFLRRYSYQLLVIFALLVLFFITIMTLYFSEKKEQEFLIEKEQTKQVATLTNALKNQIEMICNEQFIINNSIEKSEFTQVLFSDTIIIYSAIIDTKMQINNNGIIDENIFKNITEWLSIIDIDSITKKEISPLIYCSDRTIIGVINKISINKQTKYVLAIWDLNQIIERTFSNIGFINNKSLHIIDENGLIMYNNSEKNSIGKSIHEIHFNHPELYKANKQILNEENGQTTYNNSNITGEKIVNNLLTWNSFPINNKKVIVVISSVLSPKMPFSPSLKRNTLFLFILFCFILVIFYLQYLFQKRLHKKLISNVKIQSNFREMKLLETNERLKNTFESIGNAVFIVDLTGKLIMMNSVAQKITGIMFDKKRVDFIEDILHLETKENQNYINTCLTDLRENKGTIEFPDETKLISQDNKEYYISGNATTILRKNGDIYQYLFILKDITNRFQIKLKLSKNIEIYEKIFETIATATIIINVQNNKIEKINPEFEKLTNFNKTEVENKLLWQSFIKQESTNRLKEYFEKCDTEEFSSSGIEIELITRYNNIKSVLLFASYIDEKDKMVVSILDITSIKNAEKKLINSEKQYRLLAENSPDVFWMMTPEFKLKYVSPSIYNLTGYTPDECYTLGRQQFYTQESLNILTMEVSEIILAFKQKKISQLRNEIPIEIELVHKNGNLIDVELVIGPTYDERNQIVVGFQGTIRDITERKRTLQSFKIMYNIANAVNTTNDIFELYRFISNELKALIDTKNFIIGLYDEATNIISLPFMKDEKDQFEYIQADNTMSNLVIKNQRSYLLTEKEISSLIEEENLDSFGTISKTWMGVPLITEGEVIGLVVIQDYENNNAYSDHDLQLMEFISKQVAISIQRKKAQEKLLLSEDKFRTIAENLPGIIFMYDIHADGHRESVYTGPGLEKILGKKVAEKFYHNTEGFFKLIPEKDKAKLLNKSLEAKNNGGNLDIEYQIKISNDDVRWVRSISSTKKLANGSLRVLGLLFDVTEQVHRQRDLKRSEAKARVLVDAASDGIFICTKSNKIVEANRTASEMFDFSIFELEKMHFHELIIPTQIEEFELFLRNNKNQQIGKEIICLKNNGISFHTEIIVRMSSIGDEEFLLVYVRDITERKKFETKLIEAQKMDSIGNLAGGVAHDFNNMLGGITGYASLLLKMEDDKKKVKYINGIIKAVDRSAELTQKLLAFGRRGKNLAKAVNVNTIIREVVDILSHSIDKSIKVNLNLANDLYSIDADPAQINQILMNLCVNAAESIIGDGEITVSTENFRVNKKFTSAFNEYNRGDYIKIVVSDSGCGMSQEIINHIFEPFFTTKKDGEVKGTGLGLATVYGITKNHQGLLELKSKVGVGTSFILYFLKGKKVIFSEEEKETEIVHYGNKTILVVDDEEIIRSMIQEMVEMLDYNVLVAENGIKAIELYKEKLSEIDAVILDMKMPEMNGREAYIKMKEINPSIKAILATGYGKNEEAQEILDLGINDILSKPFKIADINKKLSDLFQE